MASSITDITDKKTHDTVVAEAAQTPTVIYVCNSSLPHCKTFTPEYESLAYQVRNQSKTDCSKRNVRFCRMELTAETASMFKFSPNQLPVVTLICNDRDGNSWARTITSPKIAELEEAMDGMRQRAGSLKK